MTAIHDKLRKLIEHERSARAIGSLHEAELFATKIASLLASHKLEMSDIDMKAHEAEPIVLLTAEAVKRRSYRERWCEILARGVAQMTGTEMLVSSSSNTVYFCGRKSDADMAVEQYAYLSRMAVELARVLGRKAKPEVVANVMQAHGPQSFGYQSQAMKEWRYGFVEGFASSISERMRQQVAERMNQEREARGENATGLMLVKRDAVAIAAHIAQTTGGKLSTRAPKAHTHSNIAGFQRGTEAGKSTNLNRSKELGD